MSLLNVEYRESDSERTFFKQKLPSLPFGIGDELHFENPDRHLALESGEQPTEYRFGEVTGIEFTPDDAEGFTVVVSVDL